MDNPRHYGNASGATWWPNLYLMQVALPLPGGQVSIELMQVARPWPICQLMQVTPPGGQIGN